MRPLRPSGLLFAERSRVKAYRKLVSRLPRRQRLMSDQWSPAVMQMYREETVAVEKTTRNHLVVKRRDRISRQKRRVINAYEC